MQLNSILFPAPSTNYSPDSYSGKLWFFPKAEIISGKSDFTKLKKQYIPWLFLKSQVNSSKLLIYFHGNAEDIGSAY